MVIQGSYRLDEKNISPKDVTVEMVLQRLQVCGKVKYNFKNKNILYMHREEANYTTLGRVQAMTMWFGEHEKGEFGSQYNVCHTQYFDPDDLKQAAQAFITRLHSDESQFSQEEDLGLEYLNIKQSKTLNFSSHYDYLQVMLEPFWKLVFDKTPSEMWCGGIVSAHGDKCYSYRSDWEKAGISFQHGALLYLLTYTKELGDRPKHESMEWVTENYPKYLDQIHQAEKQVLRDVYHVVE